MTAGMQYELLVHRTAGGLACARVIVEIKLMVRCKSVLTVEGGRSGCQTRGTACALAQVDPLTQAHTMAQQLLVQSYWWGLRTGRAADCGTHV